MAEPRPPYDVGHVQESLGCGADLRVSRSSDFGGTCPGTGRELGLGHGRVASRHRADVGRTEGMSVWWAKAQHPFKTHLTAEQGPVAQR